MRSTGSRQSWCRVGGTRLPNGAAMAAIPCKLLPALLIGLVRLWGQEKQNIIATANRSRYGRWMATVFESPMHATIPSKKTRKSTKAFWLKQLHMWHWMSSAVCLIGLLLFTITGITLNHAADIEAQPKSSELSAQLPQTLVAALGAAAPEGEKAVLPMPVAAWLEDHLPIRARAEAEWSDSEIYLAAPRPGGDAWVTIDRESGAITGEISTRGAVAYLNDLHKGRNSGTAWSWFIDIFAVASLVFALTGLFLLQLHAAKRKSTWPIVALGLAIPAVIAIFFIH